MMNHTAVTFLRNGILTTTACLVTSLLGTASAFAALTPGDATIDMGLTHLSSGATDTYMTSISNTGAATMITAVSISGADADSFAVSQDNCSTVVLNDGESCTVGIIFNSSNVGDHSAVLEFANDSGISPVTANLEGSGCWQFGSPGCPWNQKIVGTTTANSLWGGGGVDILDGLAGRDTLYGGSGKDRLWGRTGDDVLHPGSGDDYVDAGYGADRIYVRWQGTDEVRCGPGVDIVYADRSDRLYNCERVSYPS